MGIKKFLGDIFTPRTMNEVPKGEKLLGPSGKWQNLHDMLTGAKDGRDDVPPPPRA